MAKYYGVIGFASESVETSPGVWESKIVERTYTGDLIRNTRRLQSTDKVNDDINIANSISIIADDYANENFYCIKYATYMNSKWKVTDVEIQYPRLILTLGGLYNGE